MPSMSRHAKEFCIARQPPSLSVGHGTTRSIFAGRARILGAGRPVFAWIPFLEFVRSMDSAAHAIGASTTTLETEIAMQEVTASRETGARVRGVDGTEQVLK